MKETICINIISYDFMLLIYKKKEERRQIDVIKIAKNLKSLFYYFF